MYVSGQDTFSPSADLAPPQVSLQQAESSPGKEETRVLFCPINTLNCYLWAARFSDWRASSSLEPFSNFRWSPSWAAPGWLHLLTTTIHTVVKCSYKRTEETTAMANQVRPASGPGPSISDGNALSTYYDPSANTTHNLYFSLASPPLHPVCTSLLSPPSPLFLSRSQSCVVTRSYILLSCSFTDFRKSRIELNRARFCLLPSYSLFNTRVSILDFEAVRIKPGTKAMVLTKQRSHRDPEKFPTVQLFLLGESLACLLP
jgi:hypothetical protein